MNELLGRDPVGRVAMFVVGLAIGFRALQVALAWNAMDSYYTISAVGTVIGLVVSVVLVAGLALWRRRLSPGGVGAPRLAALAVAMVVGAAVGFLVLGAS